MCLQQARPGLRKQPTLEPVRQLDAIAALLLAVRYTFLFTGIAYFLWTISEAAYQHHSITRTDWLEVLTFSVLGPAVVWIASQWGDRLVREVRRLAQQNEAVAGIASLVVSTLDIDQVYEEFALEMKKLVDFDRVVINTVDLEAGTYTLKYLFGMVREGQAVGATLPLEGTQTCHVASTCQTLVRGDIARSQLFHTDERYLALGMRSNIGLPLISKAKVIGTMFLHSRRINAFGPQEQAILEGLARQISPALENALLYQQLQLSMEEKEVMAEIGRTISSSLNIDQVYTPFAQQVRKLIPFDRISVALVDEEAGTLFSTYSMGVSVPGHDSGNTTFLTGTITERAVSTGKGALAQGLDEEETRGLLPGTLSAYREGLRSFMAVPLISGDRTIGALNLRSTTAYAYTERHVALAEAVGHQIAGAIANAQLYAQRTKAEEALRQSEASFRNMVESAPDAIFILDQDGHINLVNSQTEAMFGYGREELLGQTIESVIPQRFRNAHIKRRGEYIAQPETRPMGSGLEIWGRRKDGTEFPVDVTLSHVRTGDGLMVTAMVRDITERKKAEERMLETGRLASVGELAAGVAHEINNPLTGVLGFSQVLLSEDLPEQVRADVERIAADAQRAANIVQNLLSFARKRDPEQHYIDVTSVLKLALDLKSYDFKTSNIEVVTEFTPDLPYTMADEHQLVQVILNILANAEQAVSAANGQGRIVVRAGSSEDKLKISISDNGPGIPPEHLHRIFEPFFTTKEVGTGTGLGLSTCYGIVRRHDGDLYVESAPGEGATFHLVLPVVAPGHGSEVSKDVGKASPTVPGVGRWGERELV